MVTRKLTVIGWTLYTLMLFAFVILLLSAGGGPAKASYPWGGGSTTTTTTSGYSCTPSYPAICPRLPLPESGTQNVPIPNDMLELSWIVDDCHTILLSYSTEYSHLQITYLDEHPEAWINCNPDGHYVFSERWTHTIGTLEHGTTYYWRVKTIKDCSGSPNYQWSEVIWSFTTESAADTTPPTPNPMTWVVVPAATGENAITMTATTASDSSGVEYYFDCLTTGGHDSSWQDSTSYTDTGLNPNTMYSYQVRARDKSPAQNATGWSTTLSATTSDTTPPNPNPMTWASVPTATGQNTIAMTASTATDEPSPPVQYYFECTTDGSKTSGWQSGTFYEASGLTPGVQYSFRVKVRDNATVQNETGWSEEKQATTQAEPASGQSPLDGATDISVNAELQWVGGAGAVSHDVHFGTAATPPLVANVTSNTYKPATMAYQTPYFWQINEKNAAGVATAGAIKSFTTETDTEKPQPDPLGWDIVPYLTGPHTISMTAQAATDLSGVKYEFSCVSHSGLDSTQTDRTYEVTGLTELQTYTFRVRAGDNWTPVNWTGYSAEMSVMIPDSTPPSPDPMTWASAPYAFDSTSISMTASTAEDTSGVQYYFDEISGNPGGNDSGWQAETSYTDSGLTPGYEYTYTVRARDMSANFNVTECSDDSSVTMADTTPPIPDPMTWAVMPHTAGPGSISMTATTAFDPSGGILYEFECTEGGGPGSGWISSPTYEATGLNEGTLYSYRVRAKDSLENSTVWSDIQSVTTVNITPPAAPTGLAATVSGGAIVLDWVDNSEPDFRSYCIYRSMTSGGPYQRIAQGIMASTYSDASIPCGVNCYYVITALDTALNESAYSSEVFNLITGRVHNTNQDTWYYNIQDAIDDAQWGDNIEVSAGTYDENIRFTGKKITLTSTNPENPEMTIIDGETSDYVIKLLSGSNGSIVAGFTIQNEITPESAGIYCAASATFNSCIVTSIGYNESVKITSGSTIEFIDCTFSGNYGTGSGMYSEPGGTLILKQCLISDNSFSYGFIYSDLGTVMISGCTFTGNTGLISPVFCSGDLVVGRCSFSFNSSGYYLDMGGAITVSGADSTAKIADSVFIGNSAANGGAIVCSYYESSSMDVTIKNCTIINNTAHGEKAIPGQGGGIYFDIIPSEGFNLIISNSILWGNSDEYGSETEAAQIYLTTGTPSPVITHSCITACSGAGSNGNIADNPSLVNDYQLSSNSPCINAGEPGCVPEEEETDVEGRRRVMGGIVDMGAYESGKVIYVNYEATPPGNGQGWATAYKYLQDALAAAVAGDEIWVTAGTYWPDEGTGHTNDSRSETFQLKEKAAIYGGFTGSVNEVSLIQRDWLSNKTILSGDLDKTNPNGTKCYHVVKGAGGALLNGFMITKGYANNVGDYGGGGMLNNDVSVSIENCIFSDNYAGIAQYGGGMYNRNGSNIMLSNCVFTGNRVDNDYSSSENGYGGAIYNVDSTTTCELINCTITANLAKNTGGIYNAGTNPVISNCIIWKNQHNSDMAGDTLAAQITGGTPVINYSCVTGWAGGGTGNISNQAPMFVMPGFWDVTIESDSIVLEATVRDFIASRNETAPTGYTVHPDFELLNYQSETGIVGELGSDIGANRKPVYALGANGEHPGISKPTTHGPTYFNMWYNDTSGYNLTTTYPLTLEKEGAGIYTFRDPQFFRIDGQLFGSHHTGDGGLHNFHFTLELHTSFVCPSDMRYFKIYKSDDDLFIYINNRLVIDLGGVHEPQAKYLKIENGDAYIYNANSTTGEPEGDPVGVIADLNLQSGVEYNFDLFYAERHTTQSHLEFSTTIPLKNSYTQGDYHLQATSPCIDTGNNDAVPAGAEQDVDAALRFFNGPAAETGNEGARGLPIVDMGAYEYQTQIAPLANNDEYSTYEERTLTVTSLGLLANDTDENGDNLTVDTASVVLPEYGLLMTNADGSFTYVPDEDFYGTDSFRYRIYDGTDVSNWATVIIEVHPLVRIYAGADKTLVYPNNQISIFDSDVTGGNPAANISINWSVDTVPLTGTVDFVPQTPEIIDSTSEQLHPTVALNIDPNIFKFEDSVDFVLKLEADDGSSGGEDYIRITLKKPTDPNSQQGPVVNPGGPYTIGVEDWLTLADAVVTDDGKPFHGFLGYRWSVVSFPLEPQRGSWEFDDEDNEYVLHPKIRFTQPGTYWLKLWATDGAKTDEGIAVVNVTGPLNHLPVVEAGGNYTTDLLPPVVLNLADLSPQPSVTDADVGDTLTTTWSVYGPVGATFRPDRSGVLREVTFERAGTYILTLTANDGKGTVSDNVTIMIAPKPQVEAGINKYVIVSESTVNVTLSDAWVREYVPPIGDITRLWTCPDKPAGATVNFNGQEDEVNPTITISGADIDSILGLYQLDLTVTDPGPGSSSDTVYVTVATGPPELPEPTCTALYAGVSNKDNTGDVYRRMSDAASWVRLSAKGTFNGPVLSLCEYNGEIYAGTKAKSNAAGFPKVMKWSDRIVKWQNVSSDHWDHSMGDITGIAGLAVYNDELYAASLYDTIFKYDGIGSTTWSIAHEDIPEMGWSVLYPWNNYLYFGFYNADIIYRLKYDDTPPVRNVMSKGGSCIWDLETYDGKIFASATYGYIYSSPDGFTWSDPLDGHPTDGESWAMGVYQDKLYMSSRAYLWKYDKTTEEFTKVLDGSWSADNGDVLSLQPFNGNLFIGSGSQERAYSDGYEGRVYKLWVDNQPSPDTTHIINFSEGQGMNPDYVKGVQCLIEALAPCEPEHLRMQTVAYAEDKDDPAGWVPASTPDKCVSPIDFDCDEIKYEIVITPNGQEDAQGLTLTTMLPDDVDFVSASGNGAYDDGSRGVVWLLDDIASNDPPVTRTLIVRINSNSVPGETVTTVYGLENDSFQTIINDDTPKVCCWSTGIIYVNKNNVSGIQNGTCWSKAFTSIEQALTCISLSNCQLSEVWVAAGTYDAGFYNDKIGWPVSGSAYQLPDGIDFYGGFVGTESSPEERNLENPANATILDCYGNIEYIVSGADDARLDGFTIRGGDSANIYCYNTSPVIANCTLESGLGYSSYYGIYCSGTSSPVITNCVIKENYYYGIYYYGYGGPVSPEITNCIIEDNGSSGIYLYCLDSPLIQGNIIRYNQYAGIDCYYTTGQMQIINNLIYGNGTYNYDHGGIYLSYTEGVAIRNNTISENWPYGIYWDYDYSPVQPVITNSIIWFNGESVEDNLSRYSSPPYYEMPKFNSVNYCYIETGETDYTGGTGNITSLDSPFADFATNDYHIRSDSLCLDTGDPETVIGPDETDIDGDARIIGSVIDIGADEYPPIKVYAGKDKEGAISVKTGTVTIKFDDAALESIDPEVSVQDLTVEWSLQPGSADGIVNFNSQKYALNPIFIFDEAGFYKLKLSAKEDADEIGSDTVEVWIDIGMSLSCVPEQVHLPDNTAVLTASDFTGGTPASIEWYGPEGLVGFVPVETSVTGDSASATVTFNGGPGRYQLIAVARDPDGDYMGQQDIWIPVTHQQLDVSAVAQPSEITLPVNRVELTGTVSGTFPDNIEWVVSDEAKNLVTFGDEHKLQTWAQFSEPGIYEIALLVYDDYDEIVGVAVTEVTVNPYDYGQLVVNAGPDQEITLPQDTVLLSGSVSGGNPDDTTEWIFSGPTCPETGYLVCFGNPDSLLTAVTFEQAGIYELALVVKNSGQVVGFDIIQITVNFEQVIVNAGPDITVAESPTPPTTVNLSGTVTGSGWDTIEWISPHSYCTITPNGTNPLLAVAAFSQPGIYEIALVAKDASDNILAADTVTVTVNYQQVTIDAGEDQEITDYPWKDTIALHGTIIAGAPASTEWIFPDVIPETYRGPSGSLNSWVKFPGPGIYQIGLVARNASSDIVGWDVVTVTVHPEGLGVTVQLTGNPVEMTLPDATTHLTGEITSGTYSSIEWVVPPVDGLIDITNEEETSPHVYSCDAVFHEPGIYEIGFVVRNHENEVLGFEKITIKVNPEPQTEFGEFKVWADPATVFLPCEPGQVTVNLHSQLTGSGSYYIKWVDPTASGLLDITDPLSENTQLTFDSSDSPGTYYVNFVVRDTDAAGDILGILTLPITVYPCDYVYLTVDAGEDQDVTLPATGPVTVILNGTVTSVPEAANLYDHVRWIDPTGELGLVSFEPIDGEDTQATFTVPGTYELALVAEDGTNTPLAGDTVTVTVHPYNQQDIYVTASAQPQVMTLLVDEKVDLIGEVRGLHNGVEWQVSTQSAPYVHFVNGITENYATSVTFDVPGIYTFTFCAKLEGEIVGWAKVDVEVKTPEVVVEAKARLKGSGEPYAREYSGISMSSDVTFDISGDVYGPLDLAYVTYEWTIVKDETGTAVLTEDSPLTPEAEVTVGGSGACKLRFAAKFQGQIIGSNILWIVLISSQPIVDCGSDMDYPVVAPGEMLILSKAKIWDNEPINHNNIEWSNVAGAHFSSQNTTNPIVWFDSENTYTLTLTYTDDDGLSASDTVDILCKYSDSRVFAGSDRTTIPFRAIGLNDAFAIPWEPDFTYKWTVESGSAAMVEFRPSDSVLNPEVLFKAHGDYVLKLTVYDGSRLFGDDLVNITVNKSPFSEENDPIVWFGDEPLPGTSPVLPACGTSSIIVSTTDEHLVDVWIEIDGRKYAEGDLRLDSGTWDDPQKLLFSITNLNTHSIPMGTSHALIAYASDKSGNIGQSAPVSFTTNCVIYDFAVNPDALTPYNQNIDFTAELDPTKFIENEWTLEVWTTKTVPTKIYTAPVGTTTTVSVIDVTMTTLGLATDGSDDGVYEAKLISNGETASVFFSVIFDAESGLTAALSEDLKITYDESGIPLESITTINQGYYDLMGKAYHGNAGLNDNVSFKIELYDDSYNARIVTPGDIDSFGYCQGAVGSGSGEGLFGTLNLSTVADGLYIMKLTVKCGTEIKTDQARVAISNYLKVGNVRFSQEDFTVDVGGFPLTVTRTYDSFNKDKLGDFGFGWQYSFANMEVQLNEERENMGGWTQRYGGEFDRDVTLNLPDGRRVTFGSYLDGYARYGVGEYSVEYTSPAGVNAQLYTKDYQILNVQDAFGTGYGAGWWWNDDYSTDDTYYPVDLSLHDFSGWILASDDGTVYNIDRRYYGSQDMGDPDWFGGYEFQAYGKPYLSSIELTSGDKIKYSVDTSDGENPKITGVIYERSGETVTNNSIQIVRDDVTGCITGIWGPGKNTGIDAADVKYTYAAGNLVKVEKLVDAAAEKYEAVMYYYQDESHAPSEHYITDVRDGRGLSPIRYVYDESGRMVGVYDVRGNYIELAHSEVPDAYGFRTETVTNRLGEPTTYKYDSEGRVVEEIKYFGTAPDEVEIKTQYQYDADNQNPSVVTDPLDNVTRYYYDSEDRVTITIDPEKNVSTNIYDSAGNVKQVSQWRPLVSEPVFPSNYPDTLPNPAQFSEVSRTVNTYYYRRYDTLALNTTGHGSLTTLIYKTEVIDPGTEQVLQETRYVYFNSGLLDEVIKVDPTGVLDDVIVKYSYDEAKSNSKDKPYSISNPYNEGETPVYTNFSLYDDSGNVIKTWQQWEDSPFAATVFTFIELDGQGRTIGTSRKVVSAQPQYPWTYNDKTGAIVLSRTVYDSIGKVDYTVNQNGVVTKNLYDDAGNLVETLVYQTEGDYLDHFRNTFEGGTGEGYPADTQGLLSISQTLYDVEGRVILSVGPYAPGEQAQGAETVYDDLGRTVETRKWEAVTIPDLVWFKVVNGKAAVSQPGNPRVGRTVNPAVYARNAWGTYASDTGTAPVSIGWKSENLLPAVKSTLIAEQEVGPLSYSKTVYDNGGRVEHSISLDESGDEQITTYAYDKSGKQTVVTDPLGHTVSRSSGIALYHGDDNAGVINLATVSLDGTHKTVTAYEGTRRKSVTDAENHTTEFQYDALGRITKTIYPSSPVTYAHVGYDGFGRKAWESKQTTKSTPASLDSLDVKEFEYDAAGRLTAVILPQVVEMESPEHNGSTIADARPRYEYVYDDYGNLKQQKDNLYEQGGTIYDTYERITEFTYNELNLQLSREMPDGRSEYKNYDPSGRIIYVQDFKNQFTGFEYNARGQLEYRKYYPNPTAYETQSPTETVQYIYDNLGRRTQVIETRGTTTYDYDGQGNLLSVASPEGTINYDYDSITGRKWSTSTANTETHYDYDEIGRLEAVELVKRNSSTVSEATSYEYTHAGNRWKMHLPNGVTTTYCYDNLNRLLTLTHYDSAGTPRLLGSYTYTLGIDGRRDSVAEVLRQPGIPDDNPVTETHDISYTYDNLNRILTEQASDGEGKGYTIEYAYDVVGNRMERKVTANTTQKVKTTYTYNAQNDRLESENNTTFSMVLPGPDNKPMYAYVSGGRVTSYGIAGLSGPVGHVRAFFLGLPSKWASWLFITALVLIPVTFFGPVVKRAISHRERRGHRVITLLRQGLIILLAYMMLLGPEWFQSLAQAASVYDDISSAAWAQTGTNVTYAYDDNGSMTSKVISGEKSFTYDYNLQNKLQRVTMTVTSTGAQEITEYVYNDGGTRVMSRSWDVSGGSPVADSKKVTYFLVDSQNHTGYDQVLEEIIYSGLDYTDPDPNPLTDTPTSRKTYTIGDDVIAQQATGDPQHLLYDGHGSTRQLSGLPDGNQRVGISEYYNYDAYGVMVDGNPTSASPAQTNMLYAGEQWDNSAQMYYLRARYYDPLNGRFNQMDTYAGNNQDPQSLHKYLYCHDNPVNGIDPTGMFEFSLVGLVQSMAIQAVMGNLLMPVLAPLVNHAASLFIPKWVRDKLELLLPDALLAGIMGSITGGYYIGLGGVGGLEALWSPLTNLAAYEYCGWTVGIMAGGGVGISGSIYGGLVYNTKTSRDYEGSFNAISIPFKKLFTKLQRKIENDITRFIGSMILWPPGMTNAAIKKALDEGPRKLAQAISLKSDAELGVFWSWGGSFGFTLGIGCTIGKGLEVSYSRAKSKQIWPSETVVF